ncbi:MAG TPA: MFS transporter [Candidatus Paceibacterota bacterium]
MRNLIIRFLPFWIFIIVYKGALLLHYSLVPIFGEKLLPVWLIGLVVGGESFIQLLLDVPAGHLVDRVGQKRILLFTTPIFLLSAALLYFKLSLTTYLLSVFVSAFSWLFFGPAVSAYILSHANKETSGKFISLRDSSASLGVVLSGAILPLVALQSQQTIVGILLSLSLIGIAFLSISPRDKAVAHRESIQPAHHRHHIRRKFITETWASIKELNPASGMLVLHMFAGALFYAAIWFVVPLLIASQQHGAIMGFGLSVFDVSIVLLGYLIGMVVDRGDKRALIFFGMILFAVTGALSGASFGILFLLFGFLASTGDETTCLSLWSWLHSLDKEHTHDGAVSGVVSFAEDLGYTIGPIVSGILYGIVGPTWTIVFGALPIAASWLVYQAFVYRHHKYQNHTRQIRSVLGSSLRRRHARKMS